ncbi:MAG TPA: hypothetical protein P5089_00780 [Candidatus Portnoybacteria bacterium]|nr:hypothetical protein [Candidatus Portnoybacteria bacterium]
MRKEYPADLRGKGESLVDWEAVFRSGQAAFMNFGDDMRAVLKEDLAKELQDKKVLSLLTSGNHEIIQPRSKISLNPMFNHQTLYFTEKGQAGEYMAARLWGFPCEVEIITHGN